MADRFLVVSSSTIDLSSTGVWSATRGGATGASVPTGSDNAYLEDGTATVTAGFTALNGVTGNVFFGPRLRLTSATALEIQAATLTYKAGGSLLPIKCVTGVALFIANPSGGVLRISASATPTEMQILPSVGEVVLESSCRPTTLYVFGNGLMEGTANFSGTLYQGGGRFVNYANVTGAVVLSQGAPNVLSVFIDHDTATMASITVNGGIYNSRSTGTKAAIVMNGGIAHPYGAPGPATITALTLRGTPDTTKFYQSVGEYSFATPGTTTRKGTADAITVDPSSPSAPPLSP